MSNSVQIPKDLALEIDALLYMSEAEKLHKLMLWRSQSRDPISMFSAYVKAKDNELLCCPECGSGDVRFDHISVRPYCNECKYWGAVNMTGTSKDATRAWNVEAIMAGR